MRDGKFLTHEQMLERYSTGIEVTLLAERNTAINQAATLRDLLTRCKEQLDPHRDAALWSDVCAALGPKP